MSFVIHTTLSSVVCAAPKQIVRGAPVRQSPDAFFGREKKRVRSESLESNADSLSASFTPTTDKGNKGLRHFSMKVCQKVKEKGVTTYNEVADELVEERQLADLLASECEEGLDSSEPHGPKNIRRRVYDALNVLMAMNIISKEKKEIRWIGLPNNSLQEFTHMEELRQRRSERIAKKTHHLHELILQQIAFKKLVERNANAAALGSQHPLDTSNRVHLPFIVVNTHKETRVNCQMAPDRSEYFFDFDKPFEIHDDIEILKRMGLANNIESGRCTAEGLAEAEKLVPAALVPYLHAMVKDNSALSAAAGPAGM